MRGKVDIPVLPEVVGAADVGVGEGGVEDVYQLGLRPGAREPTRSHCNPLIRPLSMGRHCANS